MEGSGICALTAYSRAGWGQALQASRRCVRADNALSFLIVNSASHYFDQNDLELLIEGASVFNQKFSHFFQENAESQYRIVELASEDAYLEQWLSRLIYYTLEAMLGDPIYGGNTEEIGWKSVLHVKGEPRPKSTYGSKV